MTAREPLLFIVTGYRGAGKTTFCKRMAHAAREAGWKAAGLVSNPVFEGQRRTAIVAENLASGETMQLARRDENPAPGLDYWMFDHAAVDWCNRALAASTPCDLLVVDELGPLEFERGEGWQAGFAAIESRQYAVALVVIRAELLGEALARWSESAQLTARIIEIDTPEDSDWKASTLAGQLF